jgi:hypothetical protein
MDPSSHPSPPETAAPEPTVLDLFKSVTRDWHSFFNFFASVISDERRAAVERAAVAEAERAAQPVLVLEPEAYPAEARVLAGGFPWRASAGILLAVFAQLMLEPPGRRWELSLALYLFGIGLAAWSYLSGEWQLAPFRGDQLASDPMTVRLIPLLLAGALSVMAFLSMSNDLFTWGNLLLWLLAIGCFLWATWLRRPPRLRAPLNADTRRSMLLWSAVVLAVFGLAMFFRLNQIGAIPSEPFSDHAEKLLDVYEITLGKTLIFFPRNTGREAFQMYWTLLIAKVFGTGFSFLSLKLGTALLGLLTLPFVYLLGKELGRRRLGLLALFLTGVSYWLNVIARIGLRFPLYPLFVAPVLYYLLRGFRTRNRNDFLLSGLFLGIGLHGYSPFRVVPILVLVAFAIYALHPVAREIRKQSAWWLALLSIMAFIVFIPLLRYTVDNPQEVSFRAVSRLGSVETPLPGPAPQIFLSNLWNGMRMFNWDDGEIWVNSVPHRPALDVISGALFLIGVVFLLLRYLKRRDWRDLFLLVAVLVLIMPSVLSLAYPAENPAINRASGAAVPVIMISALALDGLISAFGSQRRSQLAGWSLALALLAVSAWQNYDLVFRQFNIQFRAGAWNTSEMGQVISDFRASYGETDTVWIVPFPYWVDTRLPGVWAGIPNRDFALFRENLSNSLDSPFPKLFMYRPEDTETETALKQLYPRGVISRYPSAADASKDFMIFFVEK